MYFPAFTTPSYCEVRQSTDGPVALRQWLLPVHLDLACGNLIQTLAFYSKGKKTSHTHCPAVIKPLMPIQIYLIKFLSCFTGESYPTGAWVPPLLLLSFCLLLSLLPPSNPTAVRSRSLDMSLSNSLNFPHPSLPDLFLLCSCSFPS